MDSEKNATFIDNQGLAWHIHITFGDVMRVKQHVLGADGKPLDLCYIAETGDFRQVTDHLEIVIPSVYWLIVNNIKEISGLDSLAAQNWFYNRLDGTVLPELMKAWVEALLNFTPFPVIKVTMMEAGKLRTRAELVKAIELLAGRLQECTSMEESSDSTQKNTPMVNSQRWLKVV